MNLVKALIVLAAVGVQAGFLLVHSRVYNVAADEPHSKPVFILMDTCARLYGRARSASRHPRAAPAAHASNWDASRDGWVGSRAI